MKRLAVFLAIIFLISFCAVDISAEGLDHKSYTNSYWGSPLPAPEPYSLDYFISGEKLGIGNFNAPLDLFIDGKGNMYIADTGNNRIVILDEKGNFSSEITSVEKSDGSVHKLKAPEGVFVDVNDDIYIADSDNGVILHLNKNKELVRIIEKPTGEILDEGFIYRPTKVVVDKYGKIHVVSQFVNQGIIEFNSDGKFEGFLAAGKVSANPIEVFWKNISTREQRNRMADFVPIEYNNLALDEKGFVYATQAAIYTNIIMTSIRSKTSSEESALVRRINVLGNDILRRKGFYGPNGDVDVLDMELNQYAAFSGISNVVDVSVGENGEYSLLDGNRKKIFSYDTDGNMLYAFGGPDTSSGGLTTPSSLEQYKSKMFVIDKATGLITVYTLTEYGQMLRDANKTFNEGKYEESEKIWRALLNKNTNLDLAYTGIGKTMYINKNYKEAMEYFKLGSNTDWYSKAYKEYRKTQISVIFPILIIIGAVVFFSKQIYEFILYLKRFLRNELD